MFGTLNKNTPLLTDTERPADMRATAHDSDTADVAPSYIKALIRQLQDIKSVHMNSEYGFTGNGTEDVSAACQAVMGAGKFAVFASGTYLIGTSVVSSTILLRSTGHRENCIIKPASPAFTGYMFECTQRYILEDVFLYGYQTFGSYAIGTAQTVSVGGWMTNCNITQWDTPVRWAGDSYHPLGGFYTNVYIQGYKHAGLQFGGRGKNVINGEDAVQLVGVTITNGSAVADTVTPTVTPGATSDVLTWSALLPTPAFGYIVARSANGTTDWHVPPNWQGAGATLYLTALTATVSKSVGETWNYKVCRMTVGLYATRLKNLSIINAHLGEQSNIGALYETCSNVEVASGYCESQQGSGGVGMAPWCAVMAFEGTRLVQGSLWVDGPQYGVIAHASSRALVRHVAMGQRTGYMALCGIGTSSGIDYQGENEIGNTVARALDGGTNDLDYDINVRNYQTRDRVHIASSPSSARKGVAYLGATKAYMHADSTGGDLVGNHLDIRFSRKNPVTPAIRNESQSTFPVDTVTTPIYQFTGTTDGSASLLLHVSITTAFSGASRQVYSAVWQVTALSTGGTGPLMDVRVLVPPVVLLTNGTTPTVTPSISAVGFVITVNINIAGSAGASSSHNVTVIPLTMVGSPSSGHKLM